VLLVAMATPSAPLLPPLEDTGATFLWPIDDQPDATCYTFHFLAFVSLASAVMMITSRNPVYSALWFALVLLGNSGLFLLQQAEFLSAATVIVYAGAIVVTFLFVIMLAQPSGAARYDHHSREPLLVTLTGLILASVLVGTLHYSARFEDWGEGAANSRRPALDTIAAAVDQLRRQSVASSTGSTGSTGDFLDVGSTGLIRGQLVWNTSADLDLHLILPDHQEVFFANPSVTFNNGRATAVLDHDNQGETIDVPPTSRVENIAVNGIPSSGTYTFFVNSFNASPAGSDAFTLTVSGGGHTVQETGTLTNRQNSAPLTIVLPPGI
jgi:NADH:ubiquinone oxidoreductase subunit 6 (subunit J)